MALHYGWWLIAIVLGVAELFTGSFYLLVLAGAAACAGIAAAAGAGFTGQLVIAAIVAAVGAALVHRLRPLRRDRTPAQRSADVNLDIGQRVDVDAWNVDGRARVRYRGALWDVELMPGETAVPGRFVIREIDGSRLKLARDGTG
ncbi:MAG: NfeD family protein [Lautropia sp.]